MLGVQGRGLSSHASRDHHASPDTAPSSATGLALFIALRIFVHRPFCSSRRCLVSTDMYAFGLDRSGGPHDRQPGGRKYERRAHWFGRAAQLFACKQVHFLQNCISPSRLLAPASARHWSM